METADFNLKKLNKTHSIAVTVVITKEFKIRWFIATKLIALAGWILSCGVDVREHKKNKFDHDQLVNIFNEWAKRHAKSPGAARSYLNDSGVPLHDYGQCCAVYFQELVNEVTVENNDGINNEEN